MEENLELKIFVHVFGKDIPIPFIGHRLYEFSKDLDSLIKISSNNGDISYDLGESDMTMTFVRSYFETIAKIGNTGLKAIFLPSYLSEKVFKAGMSTALNIYLKQKEEELLQLGTSKSYIGLTKS